MKRRTVLGRMTAGGAALVLFVGILSSCSNLEVTRRSDFHLDRAADSGLGAQVTALLASSHDLGLSTRPDIDVVVALAHTSRPVSTQRWARRHDLNVRWRAGEGWAQLSGSAPAMGTALHVKIHEYRSRTGVEFYAAQRQAAVPTAIRDEVTQVGRVLNYSPLELAAPASVADDNGLSPQQLITAYDATALEKLSGHTKGTIVMFEWGAFTQADLNGFTRRAGLPALHPHLFGGIPDDEAAADETELDVEVVHAIAPDARVVIANAVPTDDGRSGQSVGLAIAQLFGRVDRQYPGAVWSLSIDWGCESLFTGADLAPVESALEIAESHGTTAFSASGDTGGLECKNTADYSLPPSDSDIGVNAVGSLPAMTSVGGTLLSTGAKGQWVAEDAWDWSSLSQGSSGGVAELQSRPSWQVGKGIRELRGTGHRLVPDVAADSDPESGVEVMIGGSAQKGGGTSQAAPIWAGFTLLIDDYLQRNGGKPVGALNPLAYRIAQHAPQPAFHDITLGGNAIDLARPGYDLVTGLGSPMVDNLAADILAIQRETR